ncbi:HpcH/HpaI aldolase/citrate lyase family protein [Halodurantibacterium flavum]|uniref:HpcH/HpaI aldolase/citrate lyase family protein n=1 Tax=Halodurantibacterium flavum TaxID=1382802 RepID=A0ABW4S335_9RHOB
MAEDARPFRSVLYIPASNPRAMEKARDLPADAIIFDLEDAVAAEAKVEARQNLVAALTLGGYGGRVCIARVNGLDTEWGRDDLTALAGVPVDGVLLPKVGDTAVLDQAADILPDIPLWAMMETPAGIRNAGAIAGHRRMAGFVLGTNDLAKDLRCHPGADRLPLMTSLQLCLLAAREAGILCIDGVYNAFRDEDGLRHETMQGRDLGFDGKTLIHPAQIAVANEVFAPSPEEVELARRQIAAWEAAQAEGRGVAVVDGRIVENLHIVTARQTLSRAAAIFGE